MKIEYNTLSKFFLKILILVFFIISVILLPVYAEGEYEIDQYHIGDIPNISHGDDYELEGMLTPIISGSQSPDGYEITGGFVQALDAGLADIDGDGDIDMNDIFQAAQRYGARCMELDYDEKVDLNGDCMIDIFDLVIISKQLTDDLDSN